MTTTFLEFLAFEAQSDEKHEYLEGRVYPKSGVDDAHNTVRGNVVALLRSATRGTGWSVFQVDMGLRIKDEAYVYPDVMLTNSPADAKLASYKQEPTLLVEVWSGTPSRSLEAVRAMRTALLNIPTLRFCWFIDTPRRCVDVYEVQNGQWTNTCVSSGTLQAPGTPVELDLNAVFENVKVAPA